MIDLTVKTLDAKNYSFSVEDDTTVAEFKEILAGTVDIEASTQRLIYRGHVLPDEAKLKDLDVHGNVVHLVLKLPPPLPSSPSSSTQSRPNTAAPPPNLRSSGMEFLGSMRFPAGGSPAQASVSANSLPRSRLIIAKRMLHRAETILTALEHPTGIQTTDQTCQVNPQDIASATTSGESLPGTSASSEPANANAPPDSESAQSFSNDDTTPTMEDEEEPINGPGLTLPTTRRYRNPDEGIPLADYSSVLEKLQSVQLRFSPFLAEYGAFMREDPAVPDDEARQRQFNINRVAEILHFLGHAYHALSDIIIRVRNSPPRALMCRPLVIQHSTIVQAGIPIQVEAQINFGTASSNNASPPANNRSTTQPQTGVPSATSNIGPTLIGFPIIPNLRAERSTASAGPIRPPTTATTSTASTRFADLILNDSENQNEASAPPVAPASISMPTGPIIRGNAANARSIIERVQQSGLTNSINTSIIERMLSEDVDLMRLPRGNSNQENQNMFAAVLNNPNVEVFMEIAPESVTVDSIETSFTSNDQQSDYIQGALNSSPDLIQSLVQVASALIGREVPTSSAPSPTTPSTETATSETPTSPGGSARTNPFQNSQARGNTQTQPTTATHTRSTSRPHVQFAQHTLTTFDPFLPCNSHHIRRRQNAGHTANNSQQSQSNEDENTTPAEESPSPQVPQGALHLWHTLMGARGGIPLGTPLHVHANLTGRRAALTTDMVNLLVQYNNVGSHNEGGSFILDTIMFLLRHLSASDFEDLLQGNPYPLSLVRVELRSFVMNRLLRINAVSAINETVLQSGVERILDELHPYIERLSGLEARDNIDVVRSVYAMLQVNLFQIINHLTYPTDCSHTVVNDLKFAFEEFWAFILRASRNGRSDVVRMFQELITFYIGTSQVSVLPWPVNNMKTVFQEYVNTLNGAANINDMHTIKVGEPYRDSERRRVKKENVPRNPPSSSARSEPTSHSAVNNDVEMSSPTRDTNLQGWKSHVPPSWVPIITTDTQRQRKQNSQPPFSDAYLSTLPTKRRKVIEDKKTPQGNSLPQIIAESVRRAVTTVNVDNSASSIDAVVQAVSSDSTLQAAYHERIRTAVQTQLRNRGDFEPTQFPNVNDYFMDYQQ